MKKQLINYETLLKVTKAMSMSTEPEEVVQLTVESVKSSLEIKGIYRCFNGYARRKSNVSHIGICEDLRPAYKDLELDCVMKFFCQENQWKT